MIIWNIFGVFKWMFGKKECINLYLVSLNLCIRKCLELFVLLLIKV